jgi:hypothetical protein
MVEVVCYLAGDSCTFIRGFDGITLLFSDASVSGVCSDNNRIMLPKSRIKRTRVKDQITRNWQGRTYGMSNGLVNC